MLAIKSGPGVLFVHTGDSVNSESFLSRLANRPAGDAIAPAFESGSGDQQMGLATLHLAEQLLRSFRRMFGKVVVAAKERRYDFAMPRQCLLQRTTGPDGSLFESGTDVGLLLRRPVRKTGSGSERREFFRS